MILKAADEDSDKPLKAKWSVGQQQTETEGAENFVEIAEDELKKRITPGEETPYTYRFNLLFLCMTAATTLLYRAYCSSIILL